MVLKERYLDINILKVCLLNTNVSDLEMGKHSLLVIASF